ncbi:MAG: ThiF family adenylyltransferase [Planctomycetota bacterium]|jgi:hypothetical protein
MKTSKQETSTQTESSGLVCRLAEGSRIKLVGLGGVGCILLEHLALFLSNLDKSMRLVLIDGDDFEPRNAERMVFRELGNKARVKASEMAPLLERTDVMVVPVPEYINEENLSRLIEAGDHVLLCVDNHPTRRLVSDFCATLPDVALFSGGNDGVVPPREWGTYGSVQVAIRRGGKDLTVPITRYHPEIANAEGDLPGGPDCAQLAESIPQIQFTNLTVAAWMLNAFFAYACGRLSYQELKFDILDGRTLPQFPLEGDEIPEPLPSPE